MSAKFLCVCVCMCVHLCVIDICTIIQNNFNVSIIFNSQQQVFNSKHLFHLQALIQTLQLLQVSAVAHLA